MLSEESDFSDVEDEIPLADQLSKKRSGGNREAGEYRVRNALKPPRSTTYTAKALYDQMHSGEIDLDPEYQRAVVWPDAKQIGIIDSMFRNFYIPPIIFAVTSHDDGSDRKVCIDGKQRLTSIQKFMDGLIPHRDSVTGEKLWFRDTPQRKKGKILPERYASLFKNKQVSCVEYSELSVDMEIEIFQRVQLGMALTSAEKLQSNHGPWPTLIRDIIRKYLGDDVIQLAGLDWDRSRGRDFMNVAACVLIISKYPNLKIAPSTAAIQKWLQDLGDPDPALVTNLNETFEIFLDLAQNNKYNSVFKHPARIAPVEFIMIIVLIAAHKHQYSLSQLSSAIGKMRRQVREEHVDIRANAKVTKTLLDIIKGPKLITVSGKEEAAVSILKRKNRSDDNIQNRQPSKLKREEKVMEMAAPVKLSQSPQNYKSSIAPIKSAAPQSSSSATLVNTQHTPSHNATSGSAHHMSNKTHLSGPSSPESNYYSQPVQQASNAAPPVAPRANRLAELRAVKATSMAPTPDQIYPSQSSSGTVYADNSYHYPPEREPGEVQWGSPHLLRSQTPASSYPPSGPSSQQNYQRNEMVDRSFSQQSAGSVSNNGHNGHKYGANTAQLPKKPSLFSSPLVTDDPRTGFNSSQAVPMQSAQYTAHNQRSPYYSQQNSQGYATGHGQRDSRYSRFNQ